MHRLLRSQLATATAAGTLDYSRLFELISDAYSQFDKDRVRSDRATRLMIEEVDALNHERNEALRAAETQNLRLEAALNNMADGLAMFDRELKLVVANAKFAEIYGFDSEALTPGASLRDLTARAVRGGFHGAQTVEDALETLYGGNGRATRQVLSHRSGRFIAVAVQPMADGGWVTTHQDITEQRRAEARIAHLALHDALTDLPNRVLLSERMEQALAQHEPETFTALYLLDLDRFKPVNDTLGHPVGDRLLQAVAKRIGTAVRDIDTVARIGGDEFAVLQPKLPGPADAARSAQRIIESVCAPYRIDGHDLVVGSSVGIALAPMDGTTPDELIRRADLALYRAKAEGRGILRLFEPWMDAERPAFQTLEEDLREAVGTGAAVREGAADPPAMRALIDHLAAELRSDPDPVALP